MKIFLSAAWLIGAILAANAGLAVITSGPRDWTINAGSTADFKVTATGATSYQWTFQGTNMPQPTNITGATKAEYKIDDTSTNQAGVYSVIVKGSTGTSVSNSAALNVIQGTIVQMYVTGFAGGGGSNIMVELFDHDKPATVQNFVHYIDSGAYSNMFFDRLLTDFVLQGGDYFAVDETNSTPPPDIGNIYTTYFSDFQVNNPPLPAQVASEFFTGPQVSNLKGTIAMALQAGNSNTAANGFFFNLVDNTNLDRFVDDQGPFTVFGRVLSGPTNGTDMLAFFNNTNYFFERSYTTIPTRTVQVTNVSTNFTTNHSIITAHVVTNVTPTKVPINIFTNGIYDDIYLGAGNTLFDHVPVNYHAANDPANDNFFFVAMSFPDTNAQPVIDTIPPTGTIASPAPNVVLTNGSLLTISGTAQDNAGLARVYCSMVPVAGNGAYGGLPIGANADGTTNWFLYFGQVECGVYTVLVTPQDGAGNLGNEITQTLTISAVLTNGFGSVTARNVTTGATGDAVGANLTPGANYVLSAQPGPGQLFVNWTVGTNVITINPNLTITMSDDLVITANFVSNALPGGISFTYPALQGNTTNGSFSVQGTINGLTNTPITLTYRLYTFTNVEQVGLARQTKTSTTNWSFGVTNLSLGHYYVQVIAEDSAGLTTIITNDFTAGLPVTLLTSGNGHGGITGNFTRLFLVEGEEYSVRATASAGSLFESWSVTTNLTNVTYTNIPAINFIMEPGLTLTATFVSNDIPGKSIFGFTFPKAGLATNLQTFNLTGTISASVTNPVLSYQLYYGSNAVAPPSTNVTIIGNTPYSTWSVGLTNLAPGYYTVAATLSDAIGRSTLISESFQILAQLTLQISPAGAGTLSSNWTKEYVSTGVPYTATARTNGGYVFAYWSLSNSMVSNAIISGGDPLRFTVATNETLTANFASNYFFKAAGTYNGLFINSDITNISATNSGAYRLTVSSNGVINMALSFPAKTLTSIGQFPLYNPGGVASASFAWTGLDGHRVTNIIYLDLTHGYFPPMQGLVTNARFSANIHAYLAATSLPAGSAILPGTNVLAIPGDHAGTNAIPGGDSYATFTVGANGSISVIGSLADNTSFSQNTTVSATNLANTNLIWTFYSPLYGGKGLILGFLDNVTNGSLEGQMAWSKPDDTGVYYSSGFLDITNAESASFSPPVALTRYQIAFGGASLTNGLTNTLTVGTNGLFTVDAGQTNKLVLTLSPKSGALTGSFIWPTAKSTNNLSGAFANPSLGGFGYFLGTNKESGFFKITEIVTP